MREAFQRTAWARRLARHPGWLANTRLQLLLFLVPPLGLLALLRPQSAWSRVYVVALILGASAFLVHAHWIADLSRRAKAERDTSAP